MLRGVIICPDKELIDELKVALAETHQVTVVRILYRYPTEGDLIRFLRAAAPELVFLGLQSVQQAVALAGQIEVHAPGTQIAAIDRGCRRDALLATMRAGIREFLSMPFELRALEESLQRLNQILERKPPSLASTDLVMAFLPSKAGVGASTIALNTSIMLSQLPDTKTLLADFDLNCGLIAFMMQIRSSHSVSSAVENAHQMDENLWQKLVTGMGELDVLPAGTLVPGYRIDSTQIRYLLEFARRNYKAICVDLSGILEKYSIEILHEAKEIFLVCTPEVPSLHLAREKLRFLRSLELDDRVKVLLNRAQPRSFVSVSQVETILERPIFMTFPNDYVGVHKALTGGKHVSRGSALGAKFRLLAEAIRGVGAAPAVHTPGLLSLLLPRKKTVFPKSPRVLAS